MVPVELGLKVPLTGPEVTLLAPGRWTSSSSLGYAWVALEQARVLGSKLLLCHRSQALNPDPVDPISDHLLGRSVIKLLVCC